MIYEHQTLLVPLHELGFAFESFVSTFVMFLYGAAVIPYLFHKIDYFFMNIYTNL